MPTLAITAGDPAGIGPEVLKKALAQLSLPPGFELELLGETSAGTPPKKSLSTARAALRALEAAVQGCREGRFAGLVTGPVCKETLAKVGFHYPGQTEFLAARCGIREDAVTMSMLGKTLRVFLLTTHVSLKKAAHMVTEERLERTLLHAHACCLRLGIGAPRLAVAGLNPHAGENGVIGSEEIEVIEPYLKKIARRHRRLALPNLTRSPDTVFAQAAQGRFDGVIALYHDQGLIPFKMVEFETGVNCTLGLPFPRTSPDHGTAFDIAGKGVANPESMLQAILLAARYV